MRGLCGTLHQGGASAIDTSADLEMDVELRVKMALYKALADTGRAPTASEVAEGTGLSLAEVRLAYEGLRSKRLLVTLAQDPDRILMAPPFSGVETPFIVHAGGRRYFANCAWDSLGVAAALAADAVIDSHDDHTGEPLRIEIKDGQPLPAPVVAHFAVPAANWWDDIEYT